jgi:large repetitive protein
MTAMPIPTSSSHFLAPIPRLERKRPQQTGFLQRLLCLMVLAMTLGGMGSAAAAVVDLSVSAYLQTPDPVPRDGMANFSVVVTNNEDLIDATGNVRLVVELPGNVDFSSNAAPAGCAFNLLASPKLLSCTRSGLEKSANWTVDFKGKGQTASALSTKATVSFVDVDTDNNSANNVSTKTLTVIKGADLSVNVSGTTGLSGCPAACTAAAGAAVGYRVDVANAGPDSASQFRVSYNLPAGADFTYTAAAGTGWACTPAGTVLTCNYSGAAIGVGQQAPPINITGRIVRNTAGTITSGASVASTDLQTGDPDESNNGPRQVVVAVKPGTDLDAKQTLVSNASGLTSLTPGEAASLNLWAVNSGTQDASGVTVKTTISSDFIIGTLPTGCSRVGQTVTCNVGALAHGATSPKFLIPLTVAETATGGANVVNVARTGPLDGLNNPASNTYSIVAPFAHLTLAKNKSPLLVQAGGDITNTISVTNSTTSTSVASGTVTVTDTLPPQETYVGFSGAGWVCSAVGQMVTCIYTIPGDLPRGAKLPNLVLSTRAQAGFTGSLTNRACTGKAAGSSHQPPDNSDTGNCADATVTSTPLNADLSIVKTASLATLPASSSTFSYTLTVSNAGPDRAPTVSVVDALPHWYNGSGGTTTGSAVLAGAGTGESCTFGSTVRCTVKELASGASRTVTITLNRPLKDGALLNTATVSSPDAIDSNTANNSSAVSATVAPIADVAVTAMASAPDPVRVGVPVVYTTSIKNNGPSNAANVVLRQVLDPARMTYVAGSATIAGSSGLCQFVPSFSGAPYAGQSGVECRSAQLDEGQSFQLVFSAIPVFPYPDALDATYTSNATITTTTFDSNASNDRNSTTVTVISKELDLSVSASDTGYEQLPFGDGILYQVTVKNNGPSLATGLKLVVTPVPPPQNGAPAPYTMLWDMAGSKLPAGAACSQPGGPGSNVNCYLDQTAASSLLANGASRVFGLKFDTGPASNAPPGTLTYAIRATVESLETGAAPFTGDKLPLNNAVEETTTVLPKTDLIMVSKTVSPDSPFSINQSFTYTLVAGNLGPAQASSVVVTDLLPAGLVLAGTPTAQLGSGVALRLNSCVSSGTPVTVTCTLGVLPVASSAADTANLVTITIPVKAPYPAYKGPFGSNIKNTASIAPTPGTSRDPNPGNNSSSVDVQIVKSSIAGSVYNDLNRSNTMDAGEKITDSVTFSLYGRDFWGNDVGTASAPLMLTTTTGDFLFDGLPRSDAAGYTLIETQPAGYADLFETVGPAGGVAPPATCEGGVNCSASEAHNTISQIVLPQNTAATGYLFQEYAYASINGYVYADINNNGLREAGEKGIPGVQLKISGLTFWGADVCASMDSACTATTDANGLYAFKNVPPSMKDESYTVTELAQPAGYADGKDQNGAGAGNVIPNSAGRAAPEGIVVGSVEPGQAYTERNFGELPLAAIAGSVFMDSNRDAVRQAGETTGVAGVMLTLAGNDYLGNPVCPTALVASCTVQSDASGNYSFAGLPPSDASGYSVTVTTPPSLVHIGAQAGSLGATIGGTVRTTGVGVTGATFKTSSGIIVTPGAAGTNYHFGQAPGNSGGTAQSISGYVYIDVNRNGRKDAGEAGITGVTITLSGLTSDGFEVCSVIGASACSVLTGADGAYRFDSLPPGGPAGYTIRQTQPTAYADGLESLGTVTGGVGGANGVISGTAPQFDQFSGIVLPTGANGANYNFGEFGASISGNVYLDLDGNGVLGAGDTPLAGVTVTLGGAATATTTTDASGSYRFEGLAAGTYTVTETQPVNYAEGGQQAGSAGGNATQVNIISAIPAARGAELTAYNFAEKAGSLAGVVYADTNNNGQRDAGEAGIGGVVLSLTGTAQDGATTLNRTATTAADGSYSFATLPNANAAGYTVVETQPAAYLDGRQSKGLVDGAACSSCDISVANIIARIAFDAGKSYTGFNFGELLPATISGSVFMDHNRDAVRQSEESTGVAGVTITLSGNDYQGNPVCPSATIASCTFVTDATGNYSIGKLPPSGPGGYAVSVTTPAHLVNIGAQSGSLGATIGGAVRAPGAGVTGSMVKAASGIVVVQGSSGTDYHFAQAPGNSGSTAQSISGFVYVDVNRNGRKDAGEAGIAGVAITLSGLTHDGFEVCSVIAASACSVLTGADGAYRFDGLPQSGPLGYTIVETQPAAYADGLESLGTVTGGAGASNGVISGIAPQFDQFSGIVLPNGGSAVNYNFGELGASISGNVYLDLDGNGVLSPGDAPLAGVTVTLSGPVTVTVVTDANGNYRFDGLPAGSYTVTETQPANYADAGQSAGPAGGNASVPNIISAIPLARGVEVQGYNFGEKSGAISGSVYVDSNDNGVRDAGETGIAGVTLTLTGTAQDGVTAVHQTMTTQADGSYSFSGLLASNAAGYTIVETQPAAYIDGRHRKGLVNGVACTGCDIGTSNVISRIVFDPAKSYTLFDFGELQGGSIAGRVYADQNDNGVYEDGEALPGVTLTLTGTDDRGNPVKLTVVTGADGSYIFTGLRPSGPGGYSVTETQPAGLGNYPAGSGSLVGSINNKAAGVADTDVIKAIVLPPQGIGTGYDFRDVASSISGFVYLDLNDNGVMDAGETGIAGVEVTLTGSSPARSAAIALTKTTGADGSFRFDGLPAGSYTLVESQPARYLDGRETAGSTGGKVDNSSFGNAPEQNSIADIVLPAATRATGYLFGERNALGKVGGSVYLDLNNDGVRNDGEKGIAGVVLTLGGNTSDGKPLKLSVTSAADGSYLFDSLPASDAAGYTLTQTQPAGYRDGKTTVLPGSIGTPVTLKPVGVSNIDVITGIKVVAGDDMRGYLFGEIGVPQLKPPIVNGYVWLNHDGSRVRPLDGSHAGVAGWTAELHQNGKFICRANTDEKGFYQFDNLHCAGYENSGLPIGAGYAITFLKDGNNMPVVPVSTGGEGVVVPGGSRIANITLHDGDAVIEQNLPLDPAGVVYDSVTRKPVAGAVVSISGPAGFDSATHLVGGTAEQTQTVGADGMYQFLLQNGFPSGVYTLSVVAPANYMLAPSSSIPACHGPLNVGLLPNPAFIQAGEFAPALPVKMESDPNSCTGLIAGGARTTQYYLSFVITNGGSAPILNNHIPLDPLGSDSIMVTKTTPMVNVTRGDLVPYTITASNPKAAALGATEVRDLIPAGFKYRSGSASRDGVPAEPVVDGRNLVWRENGFAPNEKKTYKLMLMVGTGVGDGEYTNQAWAANGGSRISNLAGATVRVVPDATFDCPDIIGKVFDDRNANGYQDEGEPGIPGVRMATARGLLVTTDAEGRFHVPCPAIPNADRGSNFVMKLDDRTLPSGYRVTTENPRDVRLTRGKVVKLNFGATVHRVVRIELTDAAFVAGGTALQAEWAGRIDGLITTLRGKPSVLRIAYLDGADAALVERRSKVLESEVRARWQALQDEYPLVIEIEGTK